MKKILVLLFVSLLAYNPLFASKVGDRTVGIGLGMLRANFTYSSQKEGVTTYSISDSENFVSEEVRVAKYFKYGRVGLAAGIGNKKSFTLNGADVSAKNKYIGIAYDYVFYNFKKFTPYIGAVLSYIKTTFEVYGYTADADGACYGIEAGMTYDINDRWELDFGARYLTSDAKWSNETEFFGTNFKDEVDINNVKQLYLEINYKF